MEQILQGLQDLDGVQGAIVFSSTGQIIRYHAHAVYDQQLLEQVCRAVVKVIDSIQLEHQDWESITAQFTEGRLLIRKMDDSLLAVIADSSLNQSFANVAIRVAVNKIKKVLESGDLDAASSSGLGSSISPIMQATGPVVGSQPPAPPLPPQNQRSTPAPSAISQSGLSWSGLGTSGMGGSVVTVEDEAMSDFLSVCAKALAYSVGPMAKVFLKESVRRLSPNTPFSRSQIPDLIADLEKHIHDPKDKEKFRAAISIE